MIGAKWLSWVVALAHGIHGVAPLLQSVFCEGRVCDPKGVEVWVALVKMLHRVNFLETKCRLDVLALCGGNGALMLCGCTRPFKEPKMGKDALCDV